MHGPLNSFGGYLLVGSCWAIPQEQLQKLKQQMDVIMALEAAKEKREQELVAQVDADLAKLGAVAPGPCHPP